MTHRSLQIACLFLAGILQSAAFVLIPALGNILTSAPYDFSSSAYALLLLGVIVSAILFGLNKRWQWWVGSLAISGALGICGYVSWFALVSQACG